MITPDFGEALEMWSNWRRGFGWPYAGGWAEQPAPVYDAIIGFQQIHDLEEGARSEREQRARAFARGGG